MEKTVTHRFWLTVLSGPDIERNLSSRPFLVLNIITQNIASDQTGEKEDQADPRNEGQHACITVSLLQLCLNDNTIGTQEENFLVFLTFFLQLFIVTCLSAFQGALQVGRNAKQLPCLLMRNTTEAVQRSGSLTT